MIRVVAGNTAAKRGKSVTPAKPRQVKEGWLSRQPAKKKIHSQLAKIPGRKRKEAAKA